MATFSCDVCGKGVSLKSVSEGICFSCFEQAIAGHLSLSMIRMIKLLKIEEKFWEFSGESKKQGDRILYQIKRISDDELGGWIEHEYQLAQDGSWIERDVAVYGNSFVFCSKIEGESSIFNSIIDKSKIDNSTIDNSQIFQATLTENNMDGCKISDTLILGCDIYDSHILNSSVLDSSLENTRFFNSVARNSEFSESAIANGSTILGSRIGASKIQNCWVEFESKDSAPTINIVPVIKDSHVESEVIVRNIDDYQIIITDNTFILNQVTIPRNNWKSRMKTIFAKLKIKNKTAKKLEKYFKNP